MGWLSELYGISLYAGYLVLLMVIIGVVILIVLSKLYRQNIK
jgi:hypothetical protein